MLRYHEKNLASASKGCPAFRSIEIEGKSGEKVQKMSRTGPGVISNEKNVVDLSPTLLSHRKNRLLPFETRRVSKLLRQLSQLALLLNSRTESNPGSGALIKPIVYGENNIFVCRQKPAHKRTEQPAARVNRDAQRVFRAEVFG